MPGTRGATERALTYRRARIRIVDRAGFKRNRQIGHLHRVKSFASLPARPPRARGRHRQPSLTSSAAAKSYPTHKVDNDGDHRNGSTDAVDIHVILR